LSSPTYHPTLAISSPGLTLRLDEVAVSDCEAVMNLAPGEAWAVDGKLIVGCAAGSALLLKKARIIASAELPSDWSRAVDSLVSKGYARSHGTHSDHGRGRACGSGLPAR
jgi:hypothetical protein